MMHGLATLLSNAIRLLYGLLPAIIFVNTEVEARDWAIAIDQKRQLVPAPTR